MPFQLLLLLVLAVRSECQTVGQEYIAAFPENIAYFYPTPPYNKLRITALHSDTEVTIKFRNTVHREISMQSGEIKQIDINANMELDKKNTSDKMVQVTSDKKITVEILSHRNNSTQTALLFPTDQLGKTYTIPPIPKTHGTTVTATVTERSPFKLIIVNNQDSNEISVGGTGGSSFSLDAGQVKQIWVEDNMAGKVITGDKPFLVLFGHPCATQFDCTCGVLYTPLEPSTSTTSRFIVPAVFNEDAADKTYLLKPSGGQSLPFSEGSMEVSGSLLLQRPGMLMNMIPEAAFGSCFAIHTVSNASENWAVIVVPAAATGDVMIGNSPAPVTSSNWKSVSGNKYKYATVQLLSEKVFIWNKSERMAVWFVATLAHGNIMFGNPAARLSVDPDYRGCVVTPEKLEVLQEEASWKESLKACKDRDMSLIVLSEEDFQNQVYKRLLGLKQNYNELWMGMRQRSYTGEWYWLNQDALNHTDWSHGFPRSDNNGRCAGIHLTDSSNPGWINKACCNKGRAVCYQPPELLTI